MRRAFPWVLAAVLAGCGRRESGGGDWLKRQLLFDRLAELRNGLVAEQEFRDRNMAAGGEVAVLAQESVEWTLRKIRETQAEIDALGRVPD